MRRKVKPKDARTAKCKGCGANIIWGKDGLNRAIPLDPTPPIYRMSDIRDGQLYVERDEYALVSHFATCPQADLFSGKNKNG